MVMRTRHGLPLALLTAGIAALAACSASQVPPLRKWANEVVGNNVELLRTLEAAPESYAARIGWQEKTYSLPDGRLVHVHPDRPGCEVHFELDHTGTVVGYTLHGRGCRGQ